MLTHTAEYPESLKESLQEGTRNFHPAPNFVATAEEAASHANPTKRKRRDVEREANELVVPMKGRMYQESSQSTSASPQA